MKRALFVFSNEGRGHSVRCGALADELRSRGWEICQLGVDSVDVVISDWPIEKLIREPSLQNKAVAIVDIPERAPGWDLLVCGSAGVTPEMFKDCGAKRVLAGPEYALLRPEFRVVKKWPPYGELPLIPGLNISLQDASDLVFDTRWVSGVAGDLMAKWMRCAGKVITYGGMRAMEAACVGAPMEIHARNEGERLNKAGLEAGAVVDGLGCQRVADAIEEMCA